MPRSRGGNKWMSKEAVARYGKTYRQSEHGKATIRKQKLAYKFRGDREAVLKNIAHLEQRIIYLREYLNALDND